MDSLLIGRLFQRTEPLDEANWLPAARLGERWALEQFYHSYQPQIYSLCCRMLNCKDDAEDAVQAAFVQAFRSLPKFRGDCLARTWIYRIAVNESLTILRRRQHSNQDLETACEAPDAAPEIHMRVSVERAMKLVKPEQRAILALRYWEDLSYLDIATILNISLPAAKMRLNRAREEFRKYYEALL